MNIYPKNLLEVALFVQFTRNGKQHAARVLRFSERSKLADLRVAFFVRPGEAGIDDPSYQESVPYSEVPQEGCWNECPTQQQPQGTGG